MKIKAAVFLFKKGFTGGVLKSPFFKDTAAKESAAVSFYIAFIGNLLKKAIIRYRRFTVNYVSTHST